MAKLPPPREKLVDPRTGLVSSAWYRWFAQFEREFDASGTVPGTGLTTETDGTLAIANDGVSNAMLRDSLGCSVIGRFQNSTGDPADIVASADDRVLGRFGGQLEFRAVSTIGATVADADYGDITVSGTGTVFTIDADAVTNAKLANMAAATIKGRASGAGAGDPTDLTAAQVKTILALAAADISDFSTAADARIAAAVGVSVQAFDADLGALAANATDGFWAHTGAGTGAARTLTAPAAGFTITNPAGIAGNPTFVLANDLAAYEGLSTAGMVVRTGDGTATTRTITGTANQISVADGSGVSGAPTLSLPSAITAPGSLTVTTNLAVNGNATLGDDGATDSHAVNGPIVGTGGSFANPSAGTYRLFGSAGDGLNIAGNGSSYDIAFSNKNGASVLLVATGSTTVQFIGPPQLPSVTVAGLPSAGTAAKLVYVSNESGGAVVAFSDGTNWRRVTDRAVVS